VYYKDITQLEEALYPKLECLKQENREKHHRERLEGEKQEKEEREQSQLQSLRVKKIEEFKNKIIQIYEFLHSLSSTQIKIWDSFVKNDALLEKIKELDIDRIWNSVADKLKTI
jgi:small-conductance mechanosensitive channel